MGSRVRRSARSSSDAGHRPLRPWIGSRSASGSSYASCSHRHLSVDTRRRARERPQPLNPAVEVVDERDYPGGRRLAVADERPHVARREPLVEPGPDLDESCDVVIAVNALTAFRALDALKQTDLLVPAHLELAQSASPAGLPERCHWPDAIERVFACQL